MPEPPDPFQAIFAAKSTFRCASHRNSRGFTDFFAFPLKKRRFQQNFAIFTDGPPFPRPRARAPPPTTTNPPTKRVPPARPGIRDWPAEPGGSTGIPAVLPFSQQIPHFPLIYTGLRCRPPILQRPPPFFADFTGFYRFLLIFYWFSLIFHDPAPFSAGLPC